MQPNQFQSGMWYGRFDIEIMVLASVQGSKQQALWSKLMVQCPVQVVQMSLDSAGMDQDHLCQRPQSRDSMDELWWA